MHQFRYCALPLLLLAGCDAQRPTREELGRVVFKASEVPVADKPYSLPDYIKKAPPEEETEGQPPGK